MLLIVSAYPCAERWARATPSQPLLAGCNCAVRKSCDMIAKQAGGSKAAAEALVARSRLRKTSPDEGFPAVAIFT